MAYQSIGIQKRTSKEHQGPEYPAVIFQVQFGFTDMTEC